MRTPFLKLHSGEKIERSKLGEKRENGGLINSPWLIVEFHLGCFREYFSGFQETTFPEEEKRRE